MASSISSGSNVLVSTTGGSAGFDASTSAGVGQGGAGGNINSINFSRVKLTCTNWAAMAGSRGIGTINSSPSLPVEGTPGSVNNSGSFNRNHTFSKSLLLLSSAGATVISSQLVLPYFGVGGSSGNVPIWGYIVLQW